MAGAARPGRLIWQLGDVVEVIDETPRTRSIVLAFRDWTGHRPGQHVEVRPTAASRRRAQRSYSIASAPEDGYVVLTVERLPDGELSPYLLDELRVGDQLEVRGPLGGYFIWEASIGGPLLLVAGGTGVVPFRSMLRHRAAAGSDVDVRLLYSAPSHEEIVYREELMHFAAYDEIDVRFALTRSWPEGWQGHRGRVDEHTLLDVSWPVDDRPLCFVCGPANFVDNVANALVALGHAPARVKMERFGPTA